MLCVEIPVVPWDKLGIVNINFGELRMIAAFMTPLQSSKDSFVSYNWYMN